MAAVTNPRSHFPKHTSNTTRRGTAGWDNRSAENQAIMPATIRFPGNRTPGDDKLPSDAVIAERIAAIQNSWSADERKRRHTMSLDRQHELEILLACG